MHTNWGHRVYVGNYSRYREMGTSLPFSPLPHHVNAPYAAAQMRSLENSVSYMSLTQ